MNLSFARFIAPLLLGAAVLNAFDADALALTGAKSRKMHNGLGPFDITLDTAAALTGNVTVEPRVIGTGHVLVFSFDQAVTVAGIATVTNASGPVGAAGIPVILPSGTEVSVTLTGIPDNKRVTVSLNGVNGSFNTSVSLGFLVGDENGSRSIDGTDVTDVKSNTALPPTAATFRFDPNINGAINAADLATIKARKNRVLESGVPVVCGGNIRCVGVGKQYTTIQAAVTAALAGDTVLVDDGTYVGFRATRSGTAVNRITIKAAGTSAIINSPNSTGDEGITISNTSYITIEGFTVTGISHYGMGAHDATSDNPMRGVQILNNTVSGSGSVNIYLSQLADSLIEGNSASGSGTSHGIYLANGGADNTILRGNRCFNNFKNGIHLNGDASIAGGDALHKNITFDGNIIYNNTDNGMDLDGVQDSLFINNVFYGNGRSAIRVFQIDAAAGAKNLRIINNTIASTGGWAVKLSEDQGGHVIFNNILFGTSGSISVGSATSAVSNNNITNNKFSADNDNSTITLAAWRTATGEDVASQNSTAAAIFKNVGANDYTLATVSIARDAGLATFATFNAPAKDALGVARPVAGLFDIGAYETP
ncbi:MAG: right-handed parallel beta-helix repeat-containing protein [Betaproteobacteria bacterium]